MSHTRIDDSFMDMIKPKVEAIKEKFSRGEGLRNDDVITLLLNSQYNHNNHLDSDVGSLKNDFSSLKNDFAVLSSNIDVKLAHIDVKIANLGKQMEESLHKNTLRIIGWGFGILALFNLLLRIAEYFITKK
ncbi:MAG: hypothetical protein QM539_06960 [Alphaproteobacteria bacterium]|nr:hypothetical protein [Alphaproteobacteria bacterium]